MGAIIASMGVAMFMYIQHEANYIEPSAGNTVKVGSVEHVITFEGIYDGNKENTPGNMFVMIGITAKNIGDEKTVISGGQVYFVDEKDQKHEAFFGEFSVINLFLEGLDPNKPIQRTIQFDVPFDEEKQYKIIIHPQKDQSTADTSVVCLRNC